MLQQAMELDPRNILLLHQLAASYLTYRRYSDEASALDRALAIEPNDALTKAVRASVNLDSQADTRALHQTIDSIRESNPGAVPNVANHWLTCALAERDADAAKEALMAERENQVSFTFIENLRFSRAFAEGVIARMTKDDGKAQSAFTAARAEQEKIVQAQPNYAPALCILGLIDAGLGRKEDALREGRRAAELLPVEKDAAGGTTMLKYLAMIGAWVGDKDLACDQLARIVRRPSDVTYGQLKLLPLWDPLRGDPRFEQIVASLAPKS
jgi:tetratricopeptide (TPR) repeat protein